jgi:hypothetical protein
VTDKAKEALERFRKEPSHIESAFVLAYEFALEHDDEPLHESDLPGFGFIWNGDHREWRLPVQASKYCETVICVAHPTQELACWGIKQWADESRINGVGLTINPKTHGEVRRLVQALGGKLQA